MRDIKSTREWTFLTLAMPALTPGILLVGIPALSPVLRTVGVIYLLLWALVIWILARRTVTRYRSLRELDERVGGPRSARGRDRQHPSHRD